MLTGDIYKKCHNPTTTWFQRIERALKRLHEALRLEKRGSYDEMVILRGSDFDQYRGWEAGCNHTNADLQQVFGEPRTTKRFQMQVELLFQQESVEGCHQLLGEAKLVSDKSQTESILILCIYTGMKKPCVWFSLSGCLLTPDKYGLKSLCICYFQNLAQGRLKSRI